MVTASRPLGPNIRAIAEGIKNDNADRARYLAGESDDYTHHPCPCCDSDERAVENVYGSVMGVRCACGHYEIVERPRRTRGMAL